MCFKIELNSYKLILFNHSLIMSNSSSEVKAEWTLVIFFLILSLQFKKLQINSHVLSSSIFRKEINANKKIKKTLLIHI